MKVSNGTKESIFLKNSLNQSFILFKDDNKNLIFNKINRDNNLITIDKDVLDFSATIDEEDRLHLLYLDNSGDLIYCIYSEDNWQKNLIGKLDVQSNIYKYLTLFVHKNTINIFYVFANIINLNLWTIEHITRNRDKLKKHVVANIFSEKVIDPFYIDSDEFGNIYLVYSGKEYNNYNIYYLFFNTFTKIWTTTPTQISSSNANNILPYLFVDSQNNIHILWYSSNNTNYLLKYKRFSSVGESKFQWKEINLPKILGYNYPALMFEKNNNLNIIYVSEEKIFNLTSNDYGNTWSLDDETYIRQYPIYLIKYYDLSLNKNYNKTNHRYGNIDNGVVSFYFDDFHEKIKQEQVEAKDTSHENETTDIISEESKIKTISDFDSHGLEKLNNTLQDLQKQLDGIKKEIKLIKDKVKDIEEKSNDKKGFFRIW